jgi:hypothetical protein
VRLNVSFESLRLALAISRVKAISEADSTLILTYSRRMPIADAMRASVSFLGKISNSSMRAASSKNLGRTRHSLRPGERRTPSPSRASCFVTSPLEGEVAA